MRVSIIGSGNVAYVLGRLFYANGIDILQVTGRNKKQVNKLAADLNAQKNYTLKEIDKSADLYILCVSDSAIQSVADVLPVKDKIVVHTSGSVAMDVLKNASVKYGVLYPLQSLRKELTYYPDIPFLINGSSNETIKSLRYCVKDFSDKVMVADDETREKLHTAAVIVSNFTNHLYTLTYQFCQKEHIEFSTLIPLIKEVAQRTQFYSPETMQTGPAVRNDNTTIQQHLQMLSPYPRIKKIYEIFSESIREMHHQ